MAKILSFRSKYDSLVEIKDNIFQKIWDWFNSLDRFAKTSLITMVLILIAGIASVGVYFDLRGHASTINPSIIDNFSTLGNWILVADTGGGASGTLTTAVSYDNSIAADMQFNFGTSGQWVGINWNNGSPPSPPSGSAASMGYYVKAPGGVHTRVILIDSGGWRFVYEPERPFEAKDQNAWFEQIVKLDAPNSYSCVPGYINATVCSTQTGQIQWPIKTMLIQVYPYVGQYNWANQAVKSGDVYIDNVQWIDTTNAMSITRDIDPTTQTVSIPVTADIFSHYGVSYQGGTISQGLPYMQQTKGLLFRRDFSWQKTETTQTIPPTYNANYVNYIDSIYSAVKSAGIKVMYILAYGNPLYKSPTDTSSCLNDANGNDSCAPTSTSALAAYINFVTYAAKNLIALDPTAPSHVQFEIWNEPYIQPTTFTPQTFAQLESQAVAAVKAVSPNFIVTVGAIVENPTFFQNYITAIKTQPNGERADAFAAHFYRQAIPETVSDDLLYAQNYLVSQGINIPVFDTEWGYPTADSSWWNFANLGNTYLVSQQADTQGLQAKMDIRKILTELALGVPYSNVYKLNDLSGDTTMWGVLDTSFTPRKAFTAITTFGNQATGYQFAGILPTQLTNLHILKFTNTSGDIMLAIWADGGGQNINVNFPSVPSQIVDYLGNVQSNISSVSVGDSPLYIKFGQFSAAPTPTPTATITITPTSTPVPTAVPASTVDIAPPSVNIVSPINNASFPRHSVVTISANASDDTYITQVVFYVNGSIVCTDATAPYTCSWNTPGKPNTPYTIKAVATDGGGITTTSAPVIVTAK